MLIGTIQEWVYLKDSEKWWTASSVFLLPQQRYGNRSWATELCWDSLFWGAGSRCGPFIGNESCIGLQPQTTLRHQSSCQRNACSLSGCGNRRWDGHLVVPLQVLPLSLLLFTDQPRTSWDAHLQDLTTAGIWTKENSDFHICILEMKAVQLALHVWNFQRSNHGRVCGLNKRQPHIGGMHKETGKQCFSSDVHSLTRNSHLDRSVHSLYHHMVHPGGEKHSYWPAQTSGPGSSDQIVFFFFCVCVCVCVCSTPCARRIGVLSVISLPQGQIRSCLCTCLLFQIPWLGIRMLSKTFGMISSLHSLL